MDGTTPGESVFFLAKANCVHQQFYIDSGNGTGGL